MIDEYLELKSPNLNLISNNSIIQENDTDLTQVDGLRHFN